MAKGWNDEAEMRNQLTMDFGRTKRIRILRKDMLSENEVVLSLLVEHENGENETPRMRVERIGNEWKLAGNYRPPTQPMP